MSNPISNVTLVYDDNHDSFEHVEHPSAHDSTVRELYALVGPDNVNTAEISTNPQHIVNTVLEKDTALDEGNVRRIWKKAVRAEQQVILLRQLIKKKVGTKDVEEHHKDQIEKKKVAKNKVRNPKVIVKDMVEKLVDAEESERRARKKKDKTRRKVEEGFGKNSNKTRTLIRNMKKEMDVFRDKIRSKNKEKVEHLTKTYVKQEKKINLPENLVRYKDIKIYEEKLGVEEMSEEILIIGDGVTIDENEAAVLRLPPKYAILEKLSEEEFEVDVEIATTKYRWDKIREGEEDLGGEEMSEDDKEIAEEFEAKARQTYDPEEKTMDMRNKKVTDVKHNPKVYLPKALQPKDEAVIEVRRCKWLEIYNKYVKEFCNEKGEQAMNLTPAQKKGLAKLRKRTKEGEIVVVLTDKSGKLAVMSMESYLEAGRVHTDKDEEVDEEFARRTQRILNGHTAMWLKIGRVGSNWRHEERHREAHLPHSNLVSAMYMLLKDHKPAGSYDPKKGPPTRPVFGAVDAMNVPFSNILSEYVEAIVEAREDTIEVISTEDMLSKADEYNSKVDSLAKPDIHEEEVTYETDEEEFEEEENTKAMDSVQTEEKVVIGADAEQLYPSLDAERSAKIVKEAAIKSKIKLEGINYNEAARYIVMNSSEAEIRTSGLRRVLPTRRYRKGTTPGVTGVEAMGSESDDEVKWIFPKVTKP